MKNYTNSIRLYHTLFFATFFALLFVPLMHQADGPSIKNPLLKKRVSERKAKNKVDNLLEKTQTNTMQELLQSLEGVNKLLDTLQVSSINDAITAVNSMQRDIQKLLAALEADSVKTGMKHKVTILRNKTMISVKSSHRVAT
jgi:flagellar motor switch protein FliG